MSEVTPAAVEQQWSVYSAAQNLPAVLNDPNRGKQSNFFVKTWGDTFVEKNDVERSPFLPEITYSHFELYLRKIGRRYRRHTRLSQTKPETNHIKAKSKSDLLVKEASLSSIPDIFLRQTFPLNDRSVFNTVFPHITNSSGNDKNHQNGRILQEKLSHYLDIVEVQIAKQVSQKSGAFFHAMTSHDTIMEQMGSACNEVRVLRSKVQKVDKTLAKDSLRLLSLAQSRANRVMLLDKMKLMATVLQTQPTLQLLFRSSDYVAALELISSTQDVLAKELAGVTCLRHLPSQLKEMSHLIDIMLKTEFKKYAAADLIRPSDATEGVLEPERLISLVAGLLRENNLEFLETYKHEAVTAAQTLLKQSMIEHLASVEDDKEHCLTGSGETTPSLDSAHWLNVLASASQALGKLVQRVRAVHDVIKYTIDVSAGLSTSEMHPSETEKFLTLEDHKRIESKLRDLLTSVCDYCHERLSNLITTQSDKHTITAAQIIELSSIVENFTQLCENVCGSRRPALSATFKIQAGNYVNKFHSQRKNKLIRLLETECWKTVEVPPEFQVLADKLASGSLTSLPHSPLLSNGGENFPKKPATALKIGTQEYVMVGTVLMLIRLVSEYCACASDLPLLAPMIGRHLTELLRTFNSKSHQLVLRGEALKLVGLNTITSTILALSSRALQLILWLIPHVRAHFSSVCGETLVGLDTVEKEIGLHIRELETKVLSIMTNLLINQLNSWSAKPPVPSQAFRNISGQLIKLYDNVSSILPEEQISDIYEMVHKNFKNLLREQISKMNIQNNGGPQHGVVTTEMIFYLETMKKLKVLPDKYFSDKAMDDIWNR